MVGERTAREARRLVKRFAEEGRERGFRRAVWEGLDTLHGYFGFPLHVTNRNPESFHIFDKEITYFRHPYNRAWRNERSVELALAFDFLSEITSGDVLELGNVTAHYGAPPHDVVDKYEDSPDVMNVDIIDFVGGPYGHVLSISTLEHVGWDETPREPEKVLRAYERLRQVLKPGGRMLITCPLGHNSYLDSLLFEGGLEFDRHAFLKRVSRHNIWVEVDRHQVVGSCYHSPFPNANTIFVGRLGA